MPEVLPFLRTLGFQVPLVSGLAGGGQQVFGMQARAAAQLSYLSRSSSCEKPKAASQLYRRSLLCQTSYGRKQVQSRSPSRGPSLPGMLFQRRPAGLEDRRRDKTQQPRRPLHAVMQDFRGNWHAAPGPMVLLTCEEILRRQHGVKRLVHRRSWQSCAELVAIGQDTGRMQSLQQLTASEAVGVRCAARL